MSSLILRSSDLEWPFNDKSLNNWSLKEEKECSELVEILRDEDDFPEEYSIKHRVYFYNDKENLIRVLNSVKIGTRISSNEK